MRKEEKIIDKKLKEAKALRGTPMRFLNILEEDGLIYLLEDETFQQKLMEISPNYQTVLETYMPKKKDFTSYLIKDGKSLLSKDEIRFIPEDKNERYEYAKYFEEKGRYDIAIGVYRSLIDEGKDQIAKFVNRYKDVSNINSESVKVSTYYKSKYSYYFCKVKNGEILTEEERKDLDELISEDKNDILSNMNESIDTMEKTFGSKVTINTFRKILGEEITLERLEKEILPKIKYEDPESRKIGEGIEKKPYDGLTPIERLELFKSLGKINVVTLGKKEMQGYVLFTYDNLTIAEKFFVFDDKAEMKVPDRLGATYFVHKDAEIDLKEVSFGELVGEKNEEMKKKDESKRLINKAVHKDISKKVRRSYSERVRDKFELMDKLNSQEIIEENKEKEFEVEIKNIPVDEKNDKEIKEIPKPENEEEPINPDIEEEIIDIEDEEPKGNSFVERVTDDELENKIYETLIEVENVRRQNDLIRTKLIRLSKEYAEKRNEKRAELEGTLDSVEADLEKEMLEQEKMLKLVEVLENTIKGIDNDTPHPGEN